MAVIPSGARRRAVEGPPRSCPRAGTTAIMHVPRGPSTARVRAPLGMTDSVALVIGVAAVKMLLQLG